MAIRRPTNTQVLAIVDALFILATNVLTLVLAPEHIPFALGLCAVLQPVVAFLAISFLAKRVTGAIRGLEQAIRTSNGAPILED
jgi:hypothetical protein